MNFYLLVTGKQFYNGRRDLWVPFYFFFSYFETWAIEKYLNILQASKI